MSEVPRMPLTARIRPSGADLMPSGTCLPGPLPLPKVRTQEKTEGAWKERAMKHHINKLWAVLAAAMLCLSPLALGASASAVSADDLDIGYARDGGVEIDEPDLGYARDGGVVVDEPDLGYARDGGVVIEDPDVGYAREGGVVVPEPDLGYAREGGVVVPEPTPVEAPVPGIDVETGVLIGLTAFALLAIGIATVMLIRRRHDHHRHVAHPA